MVSIDGIGTIIARISNCPDFISSSSSKYTKLPFNNSLDMDLNKERFISLFEITQVVRNKTYCKCAANNPVHTELCKLYR